MGISCNSSWALQCLIARRELCQAISKLLSARAASLSRNALASSIPPFA